jgi:hypothetical protein
MPAMPQCKVLPLLLALLAPALRPQVALPDLIARMEAAVGAAAGPSGGDWVLTGVMNAQGQRFEQVISIRSEPFAYREELRWLPGTPDAVPPAGVARHAVYLSDGEQSWNLADDLAPEGPLTGGAAVGVLDNALLFRLLLDPRTTLERGLRRPPRLVTEEAGLHDAGAEAVHVAWPHGTSWLAAVERTSGRLLHLHDAFHVTGRWYVLREWQALEGGATVPVEIEAGANRIKLSVVRYDSVAYGQVLPPEAFPSRPVPPLGAVEDVASLRLAHDQTPGALAVIVPEGLVAGGRGSVRDVWTLIDTGAVGASADPRLAEPLGLPLLGRQDSIGLFGGGESDWLWIDRLQLGRHALLQIPASTPPLPVHAPLPREHPVGLVLGGPRLMELSPVLDLRARRLLLRGPREDGSVRPLSEIAGRTAFTLPLVTDSRGILLIDYSLGGVGATAMLDTGYPYAARLSRADMRRMGLPLDAGEWLRRGALGIGVTGVHGHGRQELLVRLDQDLQFGPVTLQRPIVILMDEQMEGAELAADMTLLGMGALSAFEQVGFDRGRVLELVAPEEFVQPGDPTRVVVPAVEDHLGFALQPADLGATSRPHNLPHVGDVLPGLAGERAGLRDGDFLAEVEGVACDGVAPMDVWDRLRLRGRTEIRLAVLREDVRMDIVIEARRDG